MTDRPSGALWLTQAEADYDCAEYLFNANNMNLYCHIVAKYQQTVEKSIKALAVALTDADVQTIKIKFNHDLDYCLNPMLRLPHSKQNKDLQNQLSGLLDEPTRGDIYALIGLAPRQPAQEQRFTRNTEYPFQRLDGSWNVPASPNVFGRDEVVRFRKLAVRIFEGTQRLVPSLERITPVKAVLPKAPRRKPTRVKK